MAPLRFVEPGAAFAAPASGRRVASRFFPFSEYLSECGARRHLWATWVVHVDPSYGAVRNDLNCDIFCLGARLVNHVVYVPAADVSEALACTVRRGRAVVLIDRERSLYHCDQTGTGMAVPPSLAPRLEGDLGDIDVRISSDVHLEVPRVPRARELLAHQVEQAIRKVTRRHRG